MEIWSKSQSSWIVQPDLNPSQIHYEISVAKLASAEYAYEQDDEINVRVKSSNQFGFSDYTQTQSQQPNAIVMRGLPGQMQSVTRNAQTDFNEIVIDWVALAPSMDGNSAILGYNVQWKLASWSGVWADLILPES